MAGGARLTWRRHTSHTAQRSVVLIGLAVVMIVLPGVAQSSEGNSEDKCVIAEQHRSQVLFLRNAIPARFDPYRKDEPNVILEAGLVQPADANSWSLFLVTTDGTQRDRLQLTLCTPGRDRAIHVSWTYPKGEDDRWSVGADDERYDCERRFLEGIRWVYGFAGACTYEMGEPDYNKDDGIWFHDVPSPRHGVVRSMELAEKCVSAIRFVRVWRYPHYEGKLESLEPWRKRFTKDVRGNEPAGAINAHEIGIVKLAGNSVPSLYLVWGGGGTRESELALTLATPGKGPAVSVCLYWSCMDRWFNPELRWSPEAGDPEKARGSHSGSTVGDSRWTKSAWNPLYEPELEFLRRIIYAYGYLSPRDIQELADREAGLGWRLWELDNGRLTEGCLKIRKYPGGLPEHPEVLLVEGDVTYVREDWDSVVVACDSCRHERYILYQTPSAWMRVYTMTRFGRWLLIGSQAGLVAIRPDDFYMKTLLGRDEGVYDIQVNGTTAVLNEGARTIELSEIDDEPQAP